MLRRVVVVSVVAWLSVSCGGSDVEPLRGRLELAEALGGDPTGYARALRPREFSFPADHGPHRAFRTEWWYFTGNLLADGGRHFGYQLTFFRSALTPRPSTRPSAWAARDVYMAHFALTDTAAGRFDAFERFGRAALGLAGARPFPLAVWLDDWSLAEELDAGRRESSPEAVPIAGFPARLRARAAGVAIDLVVEPLRDVVLQGDRGLSQKGQEAGNASYYYSIPRLRTTGSVQTYGAIHEVVGQSWLDREWSTSVLEDGQVGWDWFSLQLDDGSDLMYYRIRRRDGGTDVHSSGTLVGADGSLVQLSPADLEITETRTWRSPRGGETYPAQWLLHLPDRDLELEVTPVLAGQELDLTFRYWEGAVSVAGRHGERVLAGKGYVELTGYADLPSPR